MASIVSSLDERYRETVHGMMTGPPVQVSILTHCKVRFSVVLTNTGRLATITRTLLIQ
jgi:hypothetical protein